MNVAFPSPDVVVVVAVPVAEQASTVLKEVVQLLVCPAEHSTLVKVAVCVEQPDVDVGVVSEAVWELVGALPSLLLVV